MDAGDLGVVAKLLQSAARLAWVLREAEAHRRSAPGCSTTANAGLSIFSSWWGRRRSFFIEILRSQGVSRPTR